MADLEKNKAIMEEEHKIMGGYMDTAKTFIQLSIGGLVLSVTFLEKILGADKGTPVSYLLMIAWVFWLLAVLAGALYQIRAVKWLATLGIDYELIEKKNHAGDPVKVYPYLIYRVLLICFFIGTIIFAIYGSIRILSLNQV